MLATDLSCLARSAVAMDAVLALALVGSPDGVDDENQRYVPPVMDDAIAALKSRSPLRGLLSELYDFKNGWSSFTIRYELPG